MMKTFTVMFLVLLGLGLAISSTKDSTSEKYYRVYGSNVCLEKMTARNDDGYKKKVKYTKIACSKIPPNIKPGVIK